MTKSTSDLFELTFVANTGGRLSDFLKLSSLYTSKEAINQAKEQLNIRLTFQKESIIKGFELLPNSPNPFNDATTIGFILPEKTKAIFEVYNLQGHLLREIEGVYQSGYHQILLTKEELGESGVLIYQIKTEHGVLTKKMLRLN